MREFAKLYPEHVDKYKIKFPIQDSIIDIVPLLTSSSDLPRKPMAKEIIVEVEQFERLLIVWNFFNSFSEWCKIPNFTLPAMHAALEYKPTKG